MQAFQIDYSGWKNNLNQCPTDYRCGSATQNRKGAGGALVDMS
jgi:hypothetical protein